MENKSKEQLDLSFRDYHNFTYMNLRIWSRLLSMNEEENNHYYTGDGIRGLLKGGIYTETLAEIRKNNQICKVPQDPHLTSHCVFDIGYNDTTSILFTNIC